MAADTEKLGSATMAELQGMVDAAARASGAVGAQVSVIVGDRRSDFVYGSANAELNIPMTVDTVTQVGSVTKVFNAALIVALAEEGKVGLDVPVVKYIPDLKLADERAQNTVTLRQLLSMSSGLDNGPYKPLKGLNALAEYVSGLRDIPQVFPPGTGYGYSNAGICVAGYVAQKVTGEAWDTLIRERIFEPAGLQHAITLAEDLPYFRVSVGHLPAQNGKAATVLRPWYISQGMGPAGSTLAMSAHDLASFGQIFVNGGKAGNGTRVLSETAVKTMMTPTTDVPIAVPVWGVGDKWGLGPNMSKWGDKVVWGHAGGNRSGVSQLLWLPERHAVLAFVLNAPGALDGFSTRMFGGFSQAVFGVSGPKLSPPDPPLHVAEPKRFVGTYVRYGMRYEITAEADRLHYKQINLGLGTPGEVLGVLIEGDLISLGGDRFMVKIPAVPDGGLPLAFFGRDSAGRALNLVDPMFAARRVD